MLRKNVCFKNFESGCKKPAKVFFDDFFSSDDFALLNKCCVESYKSLERFFVEALKQLRVVFKNGQKVAQQLFAKKKMVCQEF